MSLRRLVLERDGGICLDCKLNCEELKGTVDSIRDRLGLDAHREFVAALKPLGFTKPDHYWEMDHDDPLIEGGPDQLHNLVTRCVPCHQQKTNEDAGRRAKQRRILGKKTIETNINLKKLREK